MSTLTPGELEVYQACSQSADGTLRQKELEKAITIQGADMAAAVNGLLKKSLLKILKDSKGVLSYKAVDKADAKVVGLMDADESIVYKKIQEAKNEGIWTKHLKSTELHQSVITRVLKSLEKKGLIKSIKSVKHPTRKIYILANLQPSVEISGGPWYNNSEFETEFVQTLCNACLNFIQKRSYPVQKSNSKLSPRALFPVSQSSRYPTAADVLNFLKQTNITDTPLEIAHVESLLQVLIYDGQVEALPGSGLGGMLNFGDDEDGSDASSDEEETHKKKKKRKDKEKTSKKGKKRARDDSDSDSGSDSSDDAAARKKKRRKADSSDSDGESSSEDDSDSDSEDARAKKRKKKSKSRSKSKSKSRRGGSEDDSDSENDSDSNSGSESDRGRKKSKKSKSKKSKSKSKTKVKREPSPVEVQFDANSGRVYRAIRPERVALGWSQSPCSACPQFDFCHDDGPVNARECQYYATWLNAGVADAE